MKEKENGKNTRTYSDVWHIWREIMQISSKKRPNAANTLIYKQKVCVSDTLIIMYKNAKSLLFSERLQTLDLR